MIGAAQSTAPGTLLRRSVARPVGMVSLIRVAEISSGDRGAAVPRRLCPRWKSAVSVVAEDRIQTAAQFMCRVDKYVTDDDPPTLKRY